MLISEKSFRLAGYVAQFFLFVVDEVLKRLWGWGCMHQIKWEYMENSIEYVRYIECIAYFYKQYDIIE